MSIDLAVRDAVAQWESPTAEPDWDDVLRRARPPARRRPRRLALALVAAAAALVLALPGLGIGDRLGRLVGLAKRPGLALGATLVRADGTQAGTFTVQTGRLFVTPGQRSRPFKAVGAPIRWTLSLMAPANSARLVVHDSGKTLARLCRPCAQGATKGSNRLPRGAFSALFGRADIVVTDDQGTARGRVRLQRPARR
jgi:hypothetical protein